MRATLEQLKAMSREMLEARWLDAEFPFDWAECDRCVTGHHEDYRGGCRVHNQLRVQVTSLGPTGHTRWERFQEWLGRGQCVDSNWLNSNLEELYAMRLFFDSIYRPELEETANGDRAETSAATKPVCEIGIFGRGGSEESSK